MKKKIVHNGGSGVVFSVRLADMSPRNAPGLDLLILLQSVI